MGFIEDDSAKKERKIFTRKNFNKVKFKEEDDFADLIEEMEIQMNYQISILKSQDMDFQMEILSNH